MESALAFGSSWLMATKDNKLWPSSALEDETFMLNYLKQKELGVNRKHGRSLHLSTASATKGKKRAKFFELRDNQVVAKCLGTHLSPSPVMRAADPQPGFLREWLSAGPKSDISGKSQSPNDLLRPGKLVNGACFYQNCRQAGHRWDHCPKLAMHVAKDPTVRNRQYRQYRKYRQY